ncbi:hypothetical protein LINPERPRIM_LOCUS39355 [Linum perenne]
MQIVERRVGRDARKRRGRTCARGHAEAAVLSVGACHLAPLATITCALATPTSPPATKSTNALNFNFIIILINYGFLCIFFCYDQISSMFNNLFGSLYCFIVRCLHSKAIIYCS